MGVRNLEQLMSGTTNTTNHECYGTPGLTNSGYKEDFDLVPT